MEKKVLVELWQKLVVFELDPAPLVECMEWKKEKGSLIREVCSSNKLLLMVRTKFRYTNTNTNTQYSRAV